MKNKVDPKIIMLEHSKAKVELYNYYISIYLNILSRVKFIEKIYLYDLFAGEGIYSNKEKGSAVLVVETIKYHYFTNGEKCPNIQLTLNDSGESEIEPGKLKIEKIKEECNKIFKPNNVDIIFKSEDYNILVNKVINELNGLGRNERALVFIDPYGYKDIDPNELKLLLENKKTELILFLPIDHMYRFINKIEDESYRGGIPLRMIIKTLYPDEKTRFSNEIDFIDSLNEKLFKFVNVLASDTFTIEKERKKYYSLFYFTNNIKGFESWLKAKWKLDSDEGSGYRFDGNIKSLFSIKKEQYKLSLRNYIKEKSETTNEDIYLIGLKNGMLPSHSNKILKQLKNENKIYIESLDGVKANGFYIGDSTRKIKIIWRN